MKGVNVRVSPTTAGRILAVAEWLGVSRMAALDLILRTRGLTVSGLSMSERSSVFAGVSRSVLLETRVEAGGWLRRQGLPPRVGTGRYIQMVVDEYCQRFQPALAVGLVLSPETRSRRARVVRQVKYVRHLIGIMDRIRGHEPGVNGSAELDSRYEWVAKFEGDGDEMPCLARGARMGG